MNGLDWKLAMNELDELVKQLRAAKYTWVLYINNKKCVKYVGAHVYV